VHFEEELERVLPGDIPRREQVIEKSAQHLHLIAIANEQMNLTRITSAREAAIKHVYDCVAPWRHFDAARCVLDAGTGAGFPGIPLAVVLPEVRFVLAESTQRKARFVDHAVEALELANVQVVADRAEQRVGGRTPQIITARAIAPMGRILDLFAQALKQGSRLLLYKGGNVDGELGEAHKRRFAAQVVCRYELPDGCGSRTLIEVKAAKRGGREASLM
jgi:16S rRNA (guanine527-N7)-methyltransferase